MKCKHRPSRAWFHPVAKGINHRDISKFTSTVVRIEVRGSILFPKYIRDVFQTCSVGGRQMSAPQDGDDRALECSLDMSQRIQQP